jgi:hypothetical protein
VRTGRREVGAFLPFSPPLAGRRWPEGPDEGQLRGFEFDFPFFQYRSVYAGKQEALMIKNLDIDQTLFDRAIALSGGQTAAAVIKTALEEFIARRNSKALLDLFGKVDWDPSYDYKSERSRKT